MNIDIRVAFEIHHLPPRKRKDLARTVAAPARATVPEVTAAQAPVVLIVGPGRDDRDDDDVKTVHLRHYDGHLWEPSRHALDTLAKVLTPAEAKRAPALAAVLAEPDLGRRPTDEIIERLRRCAEAEVQNLADTYLIIDGVLHDQASEPLWEVTFFGSGDSSVKVARWSRSASEPPHSNYFRADQEQAAFAWANRDRGDREPFRWGHIEVLDPSVLTVDPQGHWLDQQFKELTDAFARLGRSLSDSDRLAVAAGSPGRIGETIGRALAAFSQDMQWSAHDRAQLMARLMATLRTDD